MLASGIRGRTRLVIFLSKGIRALQSMPIPTGSGQTFYVDLRLISSHQLLVGVPYEPYEQMVMQRILMHGDVAFDVGAHLGVHTLLLAELVGPKGRVFAFEPNPQVLPLLKRTVESMCGVSVLPFALSNRSADSVLYVPTDASMASLADWTLDPKKRTRRVSCPLLQMDSLVEASMVPKPDFVKCDVEGAEQAVFEGGRNVLNRVDAPIILFEANVNTARGFGVEPSGAMDFLSRLSEPQYLFFELTDQGTLWRVQSLRSPHANILAVPASKVHRWPELELNTHIQIESSGRRQNSSSVNHHKLERAEDNLGFGD